MLIQTEHFEVNTEMAMQQQQFGRDLQVCFCHIHVFVQKRVFYTRTGRTTWVCVERATEGQCGATCVCLCACLFLVWVKSQDSTATESE